VSDTLPPLATTIVGSYAQPGWYLSALEAIARGEFGEADVQEAADDASTIAIHDQERAGLDLISDGEVRRHDFIMGFYGRLDGLRAVPPRRQLGTYLYDSTGHFETTGPVSAPSGLGTVDEFRFASTRTSKPVKVAVAGPLTLANAIQLSTGYGGRDALLADLVQIVRDELQALAVAGCRFIQVDESCYHHQFRERPELVGEVYDAVTADLNDVTLGVHVCFGNLRGRPHSLRTYRHVLPALRRSRAQVLFLEFANREMAELDLWQELDMPQILAAGVVDVKSSYRETAEDVADRLRRVLQVCPPERVWAVPDCGFWETPRWLAFRKLQALVQGAANVREACGAK
jgi:5-methyltetrahydropteroyltriglutamate--homocysteine methyltransferase